MTTEIVELVQLKVFKQNLFKLFSDESLSPEIGLVDLRSGRFELDQLVTMPDQHAEDETAAAAADAVREIANARIEEVQSVRVDGERVDHVGHDALVVRVDGAGAGQLDLLQELAPCRLRGEGHGGDVDVLRLAEDIVETRRVGWYSEGKVGGVRVHNALAHELAADIACPAASIPWSARKMLCR